jgi:hypothetical protein
MSRSPTYPQAVLVGVTKVLPTDTTGKKTVATGKAAGAKEPGGSKIVALLATSTDTNAMDVAISILRNGVSFALGCVSVAAGSGSDGTKPSVNLLDAAGIPGLPVDRAGQHYLHLQDGDQLQVGVLSTVTADKEIDIIAMGFDYSGD